jgi:hypothetical protein
MQLGLLGFVWSTNISSSQHQNVPNTIQSLGLGDLQRQSRNDNIKTGTQHQNLHNTTQSLGLGDLQRQSRNDNIKTDTKTRCQFVERFDASQYKKK